MRKTTSTNFENQEILHEFCDAAVALNAISGRWKLSILGVLSDHAQRYTTIKETIPNITDRVLALQLKELETDGLIIKHETAEGGYALTVMGSKMIPIIRQMGDWGKAKKES
ncbi:helix-turn-helix domain-containing protein [Pedobacter nototheniae]|uniref:winged helix-turn-helix transcriptional regulator n=1 Tax=Pedobacter nototheniae TaxID=2488994 RepID=UPI002930B76F|nr:helix-turn-helix domain-containing protein [Pedobacter nototheniae]